MMTCSPSRSTLKYGSLALQSDPLIFRGFARAREGDAAASFAPVEKEASLQAFATAGRRRCSRLLRLPGGGDAQVFNEAARCWAGPCRREARNRLLSMRPLNMGTPFSALRQNFSAPQSGFAGKLGGRQVVGHRENSSCPRYVCPAAFPNLALGADGCKGAFPQSAGLIRVLRHPVVAVRAVRSPPVEVCRRWSWLGVAPDSRVRATTPGWARPGRCAAIRSARRDARPVRARRMSPSRNARRRCNALRARAPAPSRARSARP